MCAYAAAGGVSAAVALFGFVCRSTGAPLPVDAASWVVAGAAGGVLSLSLLGRDVVRHAPEQEPIVRLLSLTALIAAVWFLFFSVAYQLAWLIRFPVDLLSYSEAGFLNDILRWRLGLPIYAPALENQSTVYTPGSQLLTGWIASFLPPLRVPTLRAIQFTYVIGAALLATAAADRLATLIVPHRFTEPWLWRMWWAPALLMVATEPQLNAYTQSLNSDGLALAISMAAFLLIAQHALAPRHWHIVLMALLPAAGFFVKQNLLAWAGIFSIYLVVGQFGLLSTMAFAAVAGGLGFAAMGAAYLWWGADFWFWAITSFEPKTISIPRAIQHLLGAGAYLAMGLAAGWWLLAQAGVRERRVLALWLSWLVLLLLQAYTSGFAWASNHLGPSVVIAFSWFAALVVAVWPGSDRIPVGWRLWSAHVMAVGLVVGILSGLGFAREPRNPVPADAARYIHAIEQEFDGHDPSRVLMDHGTWVYAAHGVVMKDRGFATHVHLEPNQPITHELLAATIARIEGGAYDKILVRALDAGRSSYDFLNRGSGLRDAIHNHYREVRRIPRVDGIAMWWPRHMLDEIQVFERVRPGDGSSQDDRPPVPR